VALLQWETGLATWGGHSCYKGRQALLQGRVANLATGSGGGVRYKVRYALLHGALGFPTVDGNKVDDHPCYRRVVLLQEAVGLATIGYQFFYLWWVPLLQALGASPTRRLLWRRHLFL
jgi:hypothetical protein